MTKSYMKLYYSEFMKFLEAHSPAGAGGVGLSNVKQSLEFIVKQCDNRETMSQNVLECHAPERGGEIQWKQGVSFSRGMAL